KVKEIQGLLGSKGMIFVFFGAMTPFPFDIIGIAAGLVKYDPKKFFVAALLGKVTRYIILGVAGFYGLEILQNFFLFTGL
ncbi:MAG: VTT domain-containing protein, partial [archaeon]|nr:VTT domain-containing protein [archaeon]